MKLLYECACGVRGEHRLPCTTVALFEAVVRAHRDAGVPECSKVNLMLDVPVTTMLRTRKRLQRKTPLRRRMPL